MKDTDGVTGVMEEGQGRVIGDESVEKITKEEFETLTGVPASSTHANYLYKSIVSANDM